MTEYYLRTVITVSTVYETEERYCYAYLNFYLSDYS